jgi:universal stress protein E
MSIHRLLVDIDPARDNVPAIARAAALAQHTGATLELFASVYSHWLTGTPGAADSRLESSRETYLRDLGSWLDELGRPLADRGLVVTAHGTWHYPRHEAILERAEAIDADLVIRVAGQHSRLERLFLSATDWELIRHAPQALWLVRSSSGPPAGLNVLAAVDPGHPSGQKAELDQLLLTAACELHAALPGELHLFNAFVPPTAVTSVPIAAGAGAAAAPIPRIDDQLVDDVRRMHESRLAELADAYGIDRQRTHLGVGDAAGEIAAAVERLGIDVVVAGAVSRNWLQRWLIGSTTEAIFYAVDCDLYVVKLEDHEERNRKEESPAGHKK